MLRNQENQNKIATRGVISTFSWGQIFLKFFNATGLLKNLKKTCSLICSNLTLFIVPFFLSFFFFSFLLSFFFFSFFFTFFLSFFFFSFYLGEGRGDSPQPPSNDAPDSDSEYKSFTKIRRQIYNSTSIQDKIY